MAIPSSLHSKQQAMQRRRDAVRAGMESLLLEARSEGREELRPGELERLRHMEADLRAISRACEVGQNEIARAGTIPKFGQQSRAVNSAGRLAPLHFDDEQMRRIQSAAQRNEPCRLESRAFSTADSLIPAYLFPQVIPFAHENRLLDRLPGISWDDSPQITFIRHVSTTGAAAVTPEGGLKPELVFETDALTLPAVKLAANVGLSYEIINDFQAFQQYAGQELFKQIVDVENSQLINGNGTGGNIEGLIPAAGLNHDCSADTGPNETIWDSFEKAISELRSGPALCEPDVAVLNPTDWSTARRVKDGFSRFIVSADPSSDETNTLWGIPVIVTTQCPEGKGLLLASKFFGYVGVREPLSMRVGYANDDIVRNILRFVGEERLTLCVTRPDAIIKLTNLPAPTTLAETKSSKSKS